MYRLQGSQLLVLFGRGGGGGRFVRFRGLWVSGGWGGGGSLQLLLFCLKHASLLIHKFYLEQNKSPYLFSALVTFGEFIFISCYVFPSRRWERDVAPRQEHSLMVRWVVGSILHGGPIELF